jgi:hypothetical protein
MAPFNVAPEMPVDPEAEAHVPAAVRYRLALLDQLVPSIPMRTELTELAFEREASVPPELLVTIPAVEKGVMTGADPKVSMPVNEFAASVRAIVAFVVGNVIVVESVPARVSVFVKSSVFAAVPVSV